MPTNDIGLYLISGLLSVVAYFLKSLHGDIQSIRFYLQRIETDVAVKAKADEDRDRRIENLEETLHTK